MRHDVAARSYEQGIVIYKYLKNKFSCVSYFAPSQTMLDNLYLCGSGSHGGGG